MSVARCGAISARVARLATVLLALAPTAVAPAAQAAASNGIVTYVLENEAGSIMHDVPATFGAVFAPGDVPAGTSISAVDRHGNAIPIQVDVKARHPDGSLRHAVLTVDAPNLAAGRKLALTIVHGEPTKGAPVALDVLPANFDVVVDLDEGGNHLTASARDLLAHASKDEWLQGPLVTEWWVAGPFRNSDGKADPHLSVRFGIRSYGKDRPLRVEVDVENTWTWVPKPTTEVYDAKIRLNGKTVFDKAGMRQVPQTRWRMVYWWNDAANVFVKQDLAYLKKTRVIPNYSPKAEVKAGDLDRLYAAFAKSDHGPLGTGIITAYMPTTGGRGDIGPLPNWIVDYLLTMSRRAAQVMFSAADLAGSFYSHYRNAKTDRPTTTEEYPYISTHSNLVGRPRNLPAPDWRETHKEPKAVPQSAHEPSLDFIPYLVSGERYYLEELEFWSQWNSWGTAPEYHGFQKSLVSWDEVRGQGWSLRTLAQAAYIVPDKDPMKATLLRELKANLDWYNKTLTHNPAANVFHADQPGPDVSPWMDDFLTWAAGYTADLGFSDARAFAEWKGVFPTQRMINPDFCWILATAYRLVLTNPNGTPFPSAWHDAYDATFRRFAKKPVNPDSVKCGSAAMADALGLKPGEMAGGQYYGDGYPAVIQPALAAAVDAGTPGARQAWQRLKAVPVNVNPMWNIVPWSNK